jgi:hypothetical protein
MENSRREPPRASASPRNCDEHLAEYAETIDGAGVPDRSICSRAAA